MQGMYSTKFIIICCFLMEGFTRAFGGDIKGHVYAKNTGEQLIGVTVVLKPVPVKTSSALDGGFSFKNLQEGKYTLHLSYVGYVAFDTSISLTKAAASSILNIYLVPKSTNLSGVVITAVGNGGTDEFAKRREQMANSIVNIISANAIAISPDITVANVMQRISGVSIERGSSGDGQYAIIRGMDKRYNTTLVNGVKIPSPDNRNRYVPLDIFPAELLDRIEVIKSLTPEMEGDAAGGVINLVMKNAPDKFKIEGNIGTGYSQLSLNRNFNSFSANTVKLKSPSEKSGPGIYAPIANFPYNNLVTSLGKAPINKNASLTIGNRFLKNKLGIIVSGSYQNAYRGSNSSILLQSPTVPPAVGGHAQQPAFSDIYARQYSAKIDRSGIETKMDYNFNAENSISLFATYLQLNERRVRLTSDSLLGGYSTANNFIGSYAIFQKIETRSDLQSIYNATLQGKNKIAAHLTTDWSLVVSQAKREVPDIAQFSTGQAVNPNTNDGSFTISPPTVRNQSREWIHNTDTDISGYLNFYYKQHIAGHNALLGFGGMYRHKQRENYDNAYSLTPVSDPNSNDEQYVSIVASKFTFIPYNAALGNAAGNPGIYTFNENVGAAYGQVKYEVSTKMEVLGGVRMESTHQNYMSSLPVTVEGKSADIKYIDFLPSIQAKYSIDTKRALRFSYFRSIFRPAFADLIAFPERGSSNDSYETEGNPHLQHTVIDNVDLRYEVFPKGLDQFMIGGFYKFISNPIEYAFTQSGFGGIILSPNNFGNATNLGLEVVFRKYFGNFGVSGNYTFTHSVINSKKNFYYQSVSGEAINTTIKELRPLQGQSSNIGNFSFLYKNSKNNIDAQVAIVYTGERINTLSLYTGLDNWEKPTINLDLSAQKEFGKHYILYAKVNNLLNTPFQLIIKQPNSSYSGKYRLPFQESARYITVQSDHFYSSYLIGFRFKF